jgi:hypothetical protein
MEFLDLLLGSLQMGAHIHKHILVMHQKHLGNISLDPSNLELVHLPLRQEVIDGVPQLVLISATIGGDHLPCSVSYCILVSGPEGWTLVTAEHVRSTDDLHNCLLLFSSRAWNSLDSKLWWSGDVDAVQQIPQSASGDRASSPKVLISLASWNVSSFLASLQRVYSSSSSPSALLPPSSSSLFSSSP